MVEIIPKPEKKVPLWQIVLLYFSIFLLIATLSGLFLLGNFQKNLSQTLENLKEKVAAGKTLEEEALEEEIFKIRDKIENFALLFENRKINSNLFPFLEKISHPKVTFSNFDLNSAERKLILSGKSENFQSLGQQILIFQNQKEVKEVNLSDISLGKEGEILFQVSLLISPKIFK